MSARRQGRLVLINFTGQEGASSIPPVTADATSQGDTSPTAGHLDRTDHQAPTTALTASANASRAGPGGAGSTPVSTSTTVKRRRTSSAREANRRSHPHTVSSGLPTRPAIVRTPAPDAFAASAAPITTAMSARLTSANTGRSTCDMSQPTHRARRGRT